MNTPKEITLTQSDIDWATSVGAMRESESKRMGLPQRHGCSDEKSKSVHIDGAMGELAAARAIGVEWQASVNTFKNGGDVGAWQVRTRSSHYFDLIIRDNDRDDDVFILVTGTCPKYRVVGWIRAGDGKQKRWVKTHGGRPPAYFVPQSELNSLDLLQK